MMERGRNALRHGGKAATIATLRHQPARRHCACMHALFKVFICLQTMRTVELAHSMRQESKGSGEVQEDARECGEAVALGGEDTVV